MVTLICGTLCSGKTTLARSICRQTGAVLLSCDELMLAMFPDDGLGNEYETYATRAKAYLLQQTEALAAAGVDVVLDWGFWKRAEREQTAKRLAAKGIRVEWKETCVDEETRKAYVQARNRCVENGLIKAYFVDKALFDKALRLYEPMQEDEWKIYARFS